MTRPRVTGAGQSRQRPTLAQHGPSGLRAVARAASATSPAAARPPRKRAPRLRRGRPWPERGMSMDSWGSPRSFSMKAMVSPERQKLESSDRRSRSPRFCASSVMSEVDEVATPTNSHLTGETSTRSRTPWRAVGCDFEAEGLCGGRVGRLAGTRAACAATKWLSAVGEASLSQRRLPLSPRLLRAASAKRAGTQEPQPLPSSQPIAHRALVR